MIKTDNDIELITATVHDYFQGTYHANEELIKKAFHPDACITGSFKGKIVHWTLPEFIERVKSNNAHDAKEIYNKEIIFIDKTHDAAMVKAKVIVRDITFIDYITLLKINNEWIIRNKSFTT